MKKPYLKHADAYKLASELEDAERSENDRRVHELKIKLIVELKKHPELRDKFKTPKINFRITRTDHEERIKKESTEIIDLKNIRKTLGSAKQKQDIQAKINKKKRLIHDSKRHIEAIDAYEELSTLESKSQVTYDSNVITDVISLNGTISENGSYQEIYTPMFRTRSVEMIQNLQAVSPDFASAIGGLTQLDKAQSRISNL
jgi:hypothetical protein